MAMSKPCLESTAVSKPHKKPLNMEIVIAKKAELNSSKEKEWL